jgi:integral membrane protein
MSTSPIPADPRYLRLLSTLAMLQAVAYVVLLAASYGAGHSAASTCAGALHGALWLLYMWVLLAMIMLKMWRKRDIARLVISPLLPFGGFATVRWIKRMS